MLRGINTLSEEVTLSKPDLSPSEVTLVKCVTKTRLFKYIENFTTKKGKFSDKKF